MYYYMSLCNIPFLYACHLTYDYGMVLSVRPSVCSVIHNPCGHDIARTIWPRMLKLSVCTLYGQSKKPIFDFSFTEARICFKFCVDGP